MTEAAKKDRLQDTAPVKRVELHLHTKMSAMDAVTDTAEVIEQAARWGHPAIAITDHGVVQSFPKAWRAARGRIKLIYGMEGYLFDDTWNSGDLSGERTRQTPCHITLLARNRTGLKNLYRLVSASHVKHFKRVPCIRKSELLVYRDGLLIGSACREGELFRAAAARKDWEELKRIAAFYDYLEIQPAGGDEEAQSVNRAIVRLGEELGKPVCATGDVHFLHPGDEVCRRVLLSAKGYPDADEPCPLYFHTTEEMLEEFSWLGKEKAYEVVVTNTRLVADQAEEFDPLPRGLFLPHMENSEKELERLAWDRAHQLYGETPPKPVTDRLDRELGCILGKYDVIYLAAQKLVQRSMEHGYPVGFRGAVGSSLTAYLAGIAEVNPLPSHYRCPRCKHTEFVTESGAGCGWDLPDRMCPICGAKYDKDGFNIPFETFAGFDGGRVPDIDLNFSGEYQPAAHRHTAELFGSDHIFRAGTIGTIGEKTASRFVADYLETHDAAENRREQERLKEKLCGVRRTTGLHPGGLVIVPEEMCMEDFCPVQHPADDCGSEILTTHFAYHDLADHLLKLDLLGHDDLTMLHVLQKLAGMDTQAIPLDDPDTLSIFTSSKALGYEKDDVLGPAGVAGVSEFDTPAVRQMLAEVRPKDFDTLVRIVGFAHGTGAWPGNARELILNGTASIAETAACRDDVMLYLISKGLEPKMSYQIMEAVRKGYIRKLGFSKLWIDALREHGVPEWYIDSLSKTGYLFPRAHAVSYVMTAFRIAWFKVHHPLAFYASYFTIKGKPIDADLRSAGLGTVKQKIAEIEADGDASAFDRGLLATLRICYEFSLRGYQISEIDPLL